MSNKGAWYELHENELSFRRCKYANKTKGIFYITFRKWNCFGISVQNLKNFNYLIMLFAVCSRSSNKAFYLILMLRNVKIKIFRYTIIKWATVHWKVRFMSRFGKEMTWHFLHWPYLNVLAEYIQNHLRRRQNTCICISHLNGLEIMM